MENVITSVPAAIVFFLAIAAIIGLAVYKARKSNTTFSLEKFVDDNYYNLLEALSDTVSILTISDKDYATQEDYEKDIIRLTITKLETNCENFNIDAAIFKLVDKELLVNCLHRLIKNARMPLFLNTLDPKEIEANSALFDDDVVEAAKEEIVETEEFQKTLDEIAREEAESPIEVVDKDATNIDGLITVEDTDYKSE